MEFVPPEERMLDQFATVVADRIGAYCVAVTSVDGRQFFISYNSKSTIERIENKLAEIILELKRNARFNFDQSAIDAGKNTFSSEGEIKSHTIRNNAAKAYKIRSASKLSEAFSRHSTNARVAQFMNARWTVVKPSGKVHAELAVLSYLHATLPRCTMETRPIVYMGNNKLSCAKCEWYFRYYYRWPNSRLVVLVRGNHRLVTANWDKPAGMNEFNTFLEPGLDFIKTNNIKSGSVSQEHFYRASPRRDDFD